MKRINPPLFVALTLALLSGCAARQENPPPPAPAVAESGEHPALGAQFTNEYSKDVATSIMRKWKHPSGMDKNSRALVQIEVTHDNAVVEAEIAESDGDAAFNDSVLQAAYRDSPLPRPEGSQFNPIVNVCISQNPHRCQ